MSAGIMASAVTAPPIVVGTQEVVPDSDAGWFTRPSGIWNKPVIVAHWWNGYQSRWDGVLPHSATGGQAHKVAKGLTGTPTYGPNLDTRASTRSECVWDEANSKLYVLNAHATSTNLYRLSYSSGTDTYSIDATFPKALTTMTIGQDAGSDRNNDWPMSMYQTPNGNLWIANTAASSNDVIARRTAVSRSTDQGATWATPVNLDATSQNGCISLGHITESGTTKLVLLTNWNDEGASHGWAGFVKSWSIDQDAAAITAGNWTVEPIPAAKGIEWSDDHSSSVTYNNTIYVAYKATPNAIGELQIGLMVRAEDEDWVSYFVYPFNSSRDATRPAMVIDASYQRILVLWGELGANANISYQIAGLGDLTELETSTPTTVFVGAAGGEDFEYGSSVPRSEITQESGILALAKDRNSADIYRVMLTMG